MQSVGDYSCLHNEAQTLLQTMNLNSESLSNTLMEAFASLHQQHHYWQVQSSVSHQVLVKTIVVATQG